MPAARLLSYEPRTVGSSWPAVLTTGAGTRRSPSWVRAPQDVTERRPGKSLRLRHTGPTGWIAGCAKLRIASAVDEAEFAIGDWFEEGALRESTGGIQRPGSRQWFSDRLQMIGSTPPRVLAPQTSLNRWRAGSGCRKSIAQSALRSFRCRVESASRTLL